ncbi:hypothetical protein BayCH28_27330 [Mycolicibacterium sp. CH28]|uniref:hypothetical protein n=1 Tax=Mycolicibacterium sp. CH28 TaxID=2512237 RepID=UPI0010806955|nr:hypothetical protein [Mycolicibacterium sp. CH28]TGD83981.1 hypothetical protein BayCH28_27330 [Mycolicibacterium sp. CH28]
MSDEAERLDQPIAARCKIMYAIAGLLVLLYMVAWVALAVLFEPNLQFFSYYVIDYEHGFIRRGLAGELLDLFSTDLYFTGLMVLRWVVPAVFVASLGAVAWTTAARFGRSERRLMLALLIPLLPFGFARAVLLPTPDLLGEAALAVFALVLVSAKRERPLVVVSGIYGMTTATLTLIHEAVPFLQALGAVLAIVVLAQSSIKGQRLSVLLAIAPGLVVALALALFGRGDASSQCARLPHRAIDFPITLSRDQVLRGEHAYTDYHDWTCRFITVTTRNNPLEGFGQIGWLPWIGSMLSGVAILAVTLLLIRGISGVPFGGIRRALQGRLLWIILAVLLLLPVFATTSDWTRWWVAISFDVGVVYLLYSSRRPESSQPATRRTRFSFAVAIILLAGLPILVGINATQAVQPMIAHCDQLASDPKWVGICP